MSRDVTSLSLKPEPYINSIIALSLIEANDVKGISHNKSICLTDKIYGSFCSFLGTVTFFDGLLLIILFLIIKLKNERIEEVFLERDVAINPARFNLFI